MCPINVPECGAQPCAHSAPPVNAFRGGGVFGARPPAAVRKCPERWWGAVWISMVEAAAWHARVPWCDGVYEVVVKVWRRNVDSAWGGRVGKGKPAVQQE